MKRLLWVGDACCPSGFARATHEILEDLRHTYSVVVLGMNYRGDPYEYPYPVYAADAGGDTFGVGRLIWMCDLVKPDVIVLQNDPWNIKPYLQQLSYFEDYKNIPVVAALAVDGKNCGAAKTELTPLAQVVTWTQFGADEIREGGFEGPITVIPLGVDTQVYQPMDRREVRNKRIPTLVDKFIVGNVNRNQPRKRWDLTIEYFAEWIRSRKINDAYLYLHVAPTGDTGVQVANLMRYYGVLDRLALIAPQTWYGVPEEEMCETYNCFDVQISTTQGEGFGLTTFEGMACGIPQIVPKWSALGELCEGAAWLVPCTSTHVGPPYVNVIGGIPDKKLFISALDAMYQNPQYREQNGKAAYERATQTRYNWRSVGDAWTSMLAKMFEREPERLAAREKVTA